MYMKILIHKWLLKDLLGVITSQEWALVGAPLTTHADKPRSWHWETAYKAQSAPVSIHQKTIYSCSKNLSLFTSSLFISSQARLSQGKSSPSSSSLSKEAIRASM